MNNDLSNLGFLERWESVLCDARLFDEEIYVLFDTSGDAIILGETELRVPDLIYFKGSFDPIHNGHIALFRAAKDKYPDSGGAFALSFQTRKGHLTPRELAWRSLLIHNAGYPVVVSRSGYFSHNTAFFSKNYAGTRIIFPLGIDVLVNLINYYEFQEFNKQFSNVVFEFCFRNDDHRVLPMPYQHLPNINYLGSMGSSSVSSTEINRLKAEGDTQKVRDCMPAAVADLFLSVTIRTTYESQR